MENEQTEELWLAEKLEETPEKSWHLLAADAIRRLNDADLAEFVQLQKTRADSAKSWTVDAASLDASSYDLSTKNPNGNQAVSHRSPQAIMDEIAALDAQSAEVLQAIRALL